jgi:hypothetical protein
MSRRVDRARDDKGRWRLPADRDVASASRDKEHCTALPLHYLFDAIPVAGNH